MAACPNGCLFRRHTLVTRRPIRTVWRPSLAGFSAIRWQSGDNWEAVPYLPDGQKTCLSVVMHLDLRNLNCQNPSSTRGEPMLYSFVASPTEEFRQVLLDNHL